jgi:GNAT superfamily N-acetyltransferase
VTTEFIITRRATLLDAFRLAELSGMLGYAVDPFTLAERLQRLLESAEDAVFVAEIETSVAGWVHGTEQELLESDRRCEILGLVVDPAYRGQGVGRALVMRVEEWAIGRGLRQVSVRSNVARVESHPFYERLGYLRAKTQHAYRKALSSGARQPLPEDGPAT